VVERACPEADRHARGENDRRGARTPIPGGQDEREAGAEGGIEAKLVKTPRSLGFTRLTVAITAED
jgi:hypothetical protein